MPHFIVPTHLAVEAMRDNGYKNTAYAVAELIDNSIQAKAKNVGLLCAERNIQIKQRRVSQIHQIAVVDDGKGMDKDTLRLSLQFGNGLYLGRSNRTGMGRFGMGLPSSSISQCKHVDVWSWQEGIDNAIYCYLDMSEITKGELIEVPEPVQKPIPDKWKQLQGEFGDSGTLVVWSHIDKCIWRTAAAIIRNSKFLIGRMYRKFLHDSSVKIKMVSFDWEDPENNLNEVYAKPNDPGYLMSNTSCPPPYDKTPMFEPQGDNYEIPFKIQFNDQPLTVYVRFSYAKEAARKNDLAGKTLYGRHASKNVGISIVRAGRELDLDQSCVNQHDTRERWWGVEVEFPPSLDELFGVTNNKQAAHHFSELLKWDIEAILSQENLTISQLKSKMEDEEDPQGPLLEIANKIQSQLNVLRGLIKSQTKGIRGKHRHDDQSAETKATAVTKERQKEGFSGQSDADEKLPEREREDLVKESLIDEGFTAEEASDLTAKTLKVGLKYIWTSKALESPAFFSVKSAGAEIMIILNRNHPAYEKLIEILEEDADSIKDMEVFKEKLQNARDGLRLLLMAWARYEDEQPDGARRDAVQETRTDWGSLARQFMRNSEF